MATSSLLEFNPEIHLLLASALHPLQDAEIAGLQSACLPTIDWAAFIALASCHKLIPTVYHNLSRHVPGLVPQPVLAELKQLAELNRQHIIKILAALNRLSRWFEQTNIPLCVLKGPLLAQRLFGDVALRTSSDLDLLIDPTSLSQADALLLSNGCQRVLPDVSLAPRQWLAFQRQWYNSTYFLPELNTYIELHWAIALQDLIAPKAMRQIQARLRPLEQSCSRLYALADEDLPVYLLVHGSKHNWVRLKWLVDFVAWMQTAGDRDWSALQARMADLGLQRLLGQGLLLAHWLFSTPLPESLQPLLASEPAARRLATWSLKAILAPDYAGTETETIDKIRLTFYKLQLKGSLRYKLDTLYRLVRPLLWMRGYYLRLHRERLAATHPRNQ